MIRDDVKYKFCHLQTALTAFVTDIEKKINGVVNDVPVFIMESGDGGIYLDRKFNKIDNKEIYNKTPRVVIHLDENIQDQQDQLTNNKNVFEYLFADKAYRVNGRRVAKIITANINFVSPTYLDYLTNYEVMETIMAFPNVVSYEYSGNTYELAYLRNGGSGERPSMDVTSNSRNWVVKCDVDVQIQMMAIRPHTIIEKDSAGYTGINFQLTAKGDSDHTDTLIP